MDTCSLKYPLLLIHGLFSDESTWEKTKKDLVQLYNLSFGGHFNMIEPDKLNLEHADFYTITFSRNYDLNYREQAKEINFAIQKIKKINRKRKIVLLGHSMGGLAARAYIQLRSNTNDVHSLITMGTPHYGSPMAYLRNSTEKKAERFFNWSKRQLLKLQKNENNTKGFLLRVKDYFLRKTEGSEKDLLNFLDSSAFVDLAPGSKALNELNRKSLPENIQYVCIVGDLTMEPNSIYKNNLNKKKFKTRIRNFARQTIRSYSLKYFQHYNKDFQIYLEKYLKTKYNKNLLYDSDGVVPVLSQQIHHFKSKVKKYIVVNVASSHINLTDHSEKIYQALAVCGLIGSSKKKEKQVKIKTQQEK